MSVFSTLEDFKDHFNIQTSKDDIVICRCIAASSTFIESWLNRKLDLKTYTEKYHGNNSDYHLCRNHPIVSVQSVIVDNININSFDHDEVQIYLTNNSFNKGRFNCVVNYTAGYEIIPDDIKQACIEIAGMKYKQIETLNISSKAVAGDNVSYIVKDMPDFVKVVLKQYKQVCPI